jgi:hypothetical protein
MVALQHASTAKSGAPQPDKDGGEALQAHGAWVSRSLENHDQACHVPMMRQVLNDIEAGDLAEELRRRGIRPSQRLRVVVESIEDDELPMTAINAAGGAFDWLAEEPDLYSDADLAERYRA